jgi:hypothetical protein
MMVIKVMAMVMGVVIMLIIVTVIHTEKIINLGIGIICIITMAIIVPALIMKLGLMQPIWGCKSHQNYYMLLWR